MQVLGEFNALWIAFVNSSIKYFEKQANETQSAIRWILFIT